MGVAFLSFLGLYGPQAFIVFLPTLSSCSPSLWCRTHVVDVSVWVRNPIVNSSLHFDHCGFLQWSPSAAKRSFFDVG